MGGRCGWKSGFELLFVQRRKALLGWEGGLGAALGSVSAASGAYRSRSAWRCECTSYNLLPFRLGWHPLVPWGPWDSVWAILVVLRGFSLLIGFLTALGCLVGPWRCWWGPRSCSQFSILIYFIILCSSYWGMRYRKMILWFLAATILEVCIQNQYMAKYLIQYLSL